MPYNISCVRRTNRHYALQHAPVYAGLIAIIFWFHFSVWLLVLNLPFLAYNIYQYVSSHYLFRLTVRPSVARPRVQVSKDAKHRFYWSKREDTHTHTHMHTSIVFTEVNVNLKVRKNPFLCMHLYMRVRTSYCLLSVCLYVCLSFCLSVCLSVCLSDCLSICHSWRIGMYTYECVGIYMYIYIYIYIYIRMCIHICIRICMSRVSICICACIHMYNSYMYSSLHSHAMCAYVRLCV
jgi:hypothetical protein